MNAVEIEMELMDPRTYWQMHKSGWHSFADTAAEAHSPAISNFFHELEEAADVILFALGA
jgi:hypothetical protein